MNGPTCMRPLPRRHGKKDLTISLICLKVVAAIEKEHEERYLKLLANVEGGLVFSRDGDMIWQCSNCGHVCVGKQAPEVCPVCSHPQRIPDQSEQLLIRTGNEINDGISAGQHYAARFFSNIYKKLCNYLYLHFK